MKNKRLVKLSFTGDLMAEKNWMKKDRERTDFLATFSNIKGIFEGSDYVVANLETPFAGSKKKYTDEMYSFNTPDNFLDVIKYLDIDLVSTANNHALDRGIDGLERTLDVLDSRNISHTGTFKKNGRNHGYIKDFGGLKVSFLSYTHSTNYKINRVELSEEEKEQINLLLPIDYGYKENKGTIFKIKSKLIDIYGRERYFKLIKKRKGKLNTLTVDNITDKINISYIKKLQEDIRYLKSNSDMVIVLSHMGGQYNRQPGAMSQQFMNLYANEKVDVVIGNHPHVIQKYENVSGMHGFYSLGNFSMDPDSIFVDQTNLPEYGLIIHIYIDKVKKEIIKITYSFVLMSNQNGFKVYNYKNFIAVKPEEEVIYDLNIFHKLIANREYAELKKEYILYEG